MTTAQRTCVLCSRTGTRAFRPSLQDPRHWVCTHALACMRRISPRLCP